MEVCRLCLDLVATQGDAKPLDGETRDMVQVVAPELNLEASKNPSVCSECQKTLSRLFDFKSRVFEHEGEIREKVGDRRGTVSLKAAVTGEADPPLDPDRDKAKDRLCRTCLAPIECESFTVLRPSEPDAYLSSMLDMCLVEVDLALTKDPVMCEGCLDNLQKLHHFKSSCQDVEDKIVDYCNKNKLKESTVVDLHAVLESERPRDIEMLTVKDEDGASGSKIKDEEKEVEPKSEDEDEEMSEDEEEDEEMSEDEEVKQEELDIKSETEPGTSDSDKYDSHRDQILRGANSEFQDKSLDVFQYFTTTCFKGHNDDEKGFYTVYRKVFEQIAKEDIEFMDEKEEFCEIPSFGNSNSTYEEVTQFYNYWMSYSTKKSYSWLEPHDIRDAKGYRRLLKAIEKENKKVRQEARKERNEEIRNLVAFVRKRDKRMKEFNKQLEAQKLENRKRQEMLNKQKRLERKKLNESATEAEWAKFDNFKSELEDIEKHVAREFGDESSNSDNEEEDESNLYCVACNKVFKNPKAFENHESSKKHKENVEKLKQTMREEEESLCSDDLEEYEDIEKNGMVENIPEAADSVSDTESLASEKIDKINSLEINLSLESEQEEVISTKKKSKKKNKKPKTVLTLSNENLEKNDDVPNIINDSDNDDFNTTKKQKNRKKKQQKKPEKTQNGDDNEENAPENDATSSNNTNSKNKKNKKGKTKTEVSTADLKDVDVEHCCVMCKENFSSKNKLFDHLKKTNHGVYIPKDKAKQARKNLKDK